MYIYILVHKKISLFLVHKKNENFFIKMNFITQSIRVKKNCKIRKFNF